MRDGIPLTDADRMPWLQALSRWQQEQAAAGQSTVLACSALRRAYCDTLRIGLPGRVSCTSLARGSCSPNGSKDVRDTSCRPRCSTAASPLWSLSRLMRSAWCLTWSSPHRTDRRGRTLGVAEVRLDDVRVCPHVVSWTPIPTSCLMSSPIDQPDGVAGALGRADRRRVWPAVVRSTLPYRLCLVLTRDIEDRDRGILRVRLSEDLIGFAQFTIPRAVASGSDGDRLPAGRRDWLTSLASSLRAGCAGPPGQPHRDDAQWGDRPAGCVPPPRSPSLTVRGGSASREEQALQGPPRSGFLVVRRAQLSFSRNPREAWGAPELSSRHPDSRAEDEMHEEPVVLGHIDVGDPPDGPPRREMSSTAAQHERVLLVGRGGGRR